MKQLKINLGEKELLLRFDLGAIEDFCDEMGFDFTDFASKAMSSPKAIRLLIYHMAVAGGSDVKPEDLKRLSFEEIGKFTEFMSVESEGKA